jgi:hypothetical protein
MSPFLRPLLLLGALALAPGLPGCQTGDILSYEEFISFDVADRMTVEQVIDRLGPPLEVLESKGKRIKLVYHAHSMTGEPRKAEFFFDSEERMRQAPQLW